MTKTGIKQQLQKRAFFLEYITIAWNTIEGIAAVTIGTITGSIALVAFGLESGIEVFSSSVTVWEMRGNGNERKKMALKLIGVALLIISIYIALNAIHGFLDNHRSKPTLAGIISMLLITLIMLILGYLKKNVGRKMKNSVVLAEAHLTLLDVALSASLLSGLVLNALMGWWWVDQLLALIIAGNAFREGIKELL